ncbi:hypothetical protein I79_026169 [Cricetulus griseus]|uniref:Uncharacterized protein n=1 Tax=Cricetulus griseus TaxID=10029 RepID=G3IQ72_CRIGR|nr:hypothetical protein I79_026169 [Cricetulus griseus]
MHLSPPAVQNGAKLGKEAETSIKQDENLAGLEDEMQKGHPGGGALLEKDLRKDDRPAPGRYRRNKAQRPVFVNSRVT